MGSSYCVRFNNVTDSDSIRAKLVNMAPRTDRAPRQRLAVEQRRERILEAARHLYAEAAYTEVTTARVAQAADASPALVLHYFGSKAGLYAAVVRDAVDSLAAAQQAADAALPVGVPVRDRVRSALLVYLDHIADHPGTWASPLVGGEEPSAAVELRQVARAEQVETLNGLLKPAALARSEYALRGYFGFVDQACLAWVLAGCPDADRHPLVDAALGALDGALGASGK